MKRRICVLLALAVCLGLGAPALAAGSAEAGADNILPDAWAFFNEEVTHRDYLITNGRMAYFFLEGEDSAACYEYIDLLQSGRFGFTLTESWEESGSHKTVYCVFDYPGAGADQEITSELGDGDVSGDLIVTVYDWQDGGWCDLFIRFSDALTVVDTGDRCTITGLGDWVSADSTGPMGSAIIDDDDPSPTPLWHEQKCYKCHGAGNVECYQCDGDGGKWIYANTVRTWQRCFRCGGTGEMTCPICHGEGTI